MELYFFRHGAAGQRDEAKYPDDRQRPLTEDGIKKTKAAAEGLQRLDVSFDAILTSPWVRALETAEIVAKIFGKRNDVEQIAELEGDRPADDLIQALGDRRASRLLVVGHQPQLGEAVSRLICPAGHVEVALKKSGVAAVEIEALPPKNPAALLWLMTPKQLRAIRK